MADKLFLTYGKEKIGFEVPHLLLQTPPILPKETAAKKGTLQEIILSAVKSPKGSRSLFEIVRGKTVALVSSDEFRAGLQKEIVTTLIPEIVNAHPVKIKVFIATGSHEPEIYAGNVKKWAQEAFKKCNVKYEIIANNCTGPDFVEIGKTSTGTPLFINKHLLSCEVRIYAHEAKLHYMNGYSCIDKQVLPGVSSMKTIESSHKNSLDHTNSTAGRNPWHKDNSRQHNPFAQAAKEGRQISEQFFWNEEKKELEKKEIKVFGLDMVSDKDKIYWIMAGDPDVITGEMTAAVDDISIFKVKRAKYVVVSPGGPPVCDTIYSTQNCFDMAIKGAIEDNGEVLVIAPCVGREDVPEEARGLAPDMKSKELFWDNLVNLKDKPLNECSEFIDKNFRLYLWKTDRVLKLMKENNVKIYLHSELPDEKIKQGGLIPVSDIQKWIDERANRKDGKFLVIDNGNKILVQGQ